MSNSKIHTHQFYFPLSDGIEATPSRLHFFHSRPRRMPWPHWHAQVEVNFVTEGTVRYAFGHREFDLEAGDMCIFWGGQPHRMLETSQDAHFAGVHLPLSYFFRLSLPASVSSQLVAGAIAVTSATDTSDLLNFQRWVPWSSSADEKLRSNAIGELLLRIERIFLTDYKIVEAAAGVQIARSAQPANAFLTMCDFVAENFLDDIAVADVARAAGLHPKYAMNLFKRTSGLTLNNYLTLLRISYAQAKLLTGSDSVLNIAMEAGFGSISAFNKAFRLIAKTAPTKFRQTPHPIGSFGEKGLDGS